MGTVMRAFDARFWIRRVFRAMGRENKKARAVVTVLQGDGRMMTMNGGVIDCGTVHLANVTGSLMRKELIRILE